MIPAKQLMIGNWVEHMGYKNPIRQITQIYDCEYSELNPIPLTPEIIKKAGFEVDKDYHQKFVTTYSLYKLGVGTAFINHIADDKEGMFFRMHNPTECENVFLVKTVHQLQNLYFALTGEELIIDL